MYSLKELKADVEGFDLSLARLFVLCISERLYPNFLHFSEMTGFGSPRYLSEILDGFWVAVRSGSSVDHSEEMIIEIENQAPFPEDYETIFASSALDFVNSVLLLERLDSANFLRSICEAASYSRDTIDMFLQIKYPGVEYGDVDSFVMEHPLMKVEMRLQKTLIDRLIGANFSIAELEKEFRRVDQGNLGSLVGESGI